MLDPWAITKPRRPQGGHRPPTASRSGDPCRPAWPTSSTASPIQAGPTTTLTGPVTDTAELYGLIARLECLGLTLLSVQPFTSSTTHELAEPDIPHTAKEHRDD